MRLSAEDMEYEALAMRMWEKPLDKHLIDVMNVDEDFYYYHRSHETMWTTQALEEKTRNFIEIIDDVKGVDELFNLGK